ncbi:hypothetical protein LUZ60_002020 [Juncus effusus]|nr:hypothetical protein LUZ60_002020 [Juncus effusus]
MRTALAAAIAGAAGGFCVLVLLFFIIYFIILRLRTNSRSSGTGSSDPSVQGGRGAELSITSGMSSGTRQLTLEELNAATKNFSDDMNLIGRGMFGDVYKGLLHDGNFIAVKRRFCPPSQQFVQEVNYLSTIRHRNVVSLLGYSQENNLQMLVYEYVPNGSVSTHLFGTNQVSRLEFKNRLNIAHGAAKGLSYLHSLNPPLIHMDFKTANVLVDENFIAKVADAGLKSLLDRVGGPTGPGPSYSTSIDDPFLDPNVKETGRYTKESDVYSFGVFLVELVSGKEAKSNQSIIQLLQDYSSSNNNASQIIDERMGGNFTAEGMGEFLRLISWCLNPVTGKRPPLNYIELEMERISEMEMSLTTIMGEQGTPIVTLGSQLFKPK